MAGDAQEELARAGEEKLADWSMPRVNEAAWGVLPRTMPSPSSSELTSPASPPRRSASPSEIPTSLHLSPWKAVSSTETSNKLLPLRTRNLSPASSVGRRSPNLSPKSSSRSLLPPPMTRSQSMPAVEDSTWRSHTYSPTRATRASSPLGSSRRYRTSSSRRSDDTLVEAIGLPMSFLDEPVPEDSELPSTNPTLTTSNIPLSATAPLLYSSNSFPRRRPPPPILRPLLQPPLLAFIPSTPTSTCSSPLLATARFNEGYPTSTSAGTHPYSFSSNSSLPSSPTSARSRSPSISSLETIPDSPDAEEAALRAEQIQRLKEAAHAAEVDSRAPSHRRRSSVDNNTIGSPTKAPSLMIQMTSSPSGVPLPRDKKKRWSVCGGERRADLDLETIWED